VPKAEKEENEADAVTKESNNAYHGYDSCARNSRALKEGQAYIDGPCHESFEHGNLNRVGRRKFACQVVVNAPTEACSGD
jgi:hypothetical protein